jgi:hypothetical protein
VSGLDPRVLAGAREKRARMLAELKRIEDGEVPGVTAAELEMLRDQVRELDCLLRDHALPPPN